VALTPLQSKALPETEFPMAQIKVHKAQELHYTQSRYAEAPKLPARALIVAPSGSGKTVALVSLLIDLLRQSDGSSCFARIYIISPTIHLDPQWRPVMDFQKRTMSEPQRQFCKEL
jgi:superfamily II DNA or RNA helicase